ncbi:hypothetical protein Tcan_01118, partial [Toxocara canis]
MIIFLTGMSAQCVCCGTQKRAAVYCISLPRFRSLLRHVSVRCILEVRTNRCRRVPFMPSSPIHCILLFDFSIRFVYRFSHVFLHLLSPIFNHKVDCAVVFSLNPQAIYRGIPIREREQTIKEAAGGSGLPHLN